MDVVAVVAHHYTNALGSFADPFHLVRNVDVILKRAFLLLQSFPFLVSRRYLCCEDRSCVLNLIDSPLIATQQVEDNTCQGR